MADSNLLLVHSLENIQINFTFSERIMQIELHCLLFLE